MLTTTKDIDLRGYRTPAGAAKALQKAIRAGIAKERADTEAEGFTYRGPQERYVILRGPDDDDESWAQNGWHLLWEEGSYDWAVCATMGAGIYSSEGYGPCGAKVLFPDPSVGWIAEPGFGFSLVFRKW